MVDRSETNSAIQKAIAILEKVSRATRPLAISDISTHLGLSRQTVHRVIRQLEDSGMLVRDPAGARYFIGSRLHRLAFSAIMTSQSTGATHALLRRLVEELQETCNIGMLDGQEVIYVDRVECDWPLRVQLKIGSHVPIHCTAIGKLLLAHQDTDNRQRLLGPPPLIRYTANTITDLQLLEAELDRILDQGYSVNHQEDAVGLIALAVPVRDPWGNIIAGLAVHAPEARLSLGRVREILPQLNETATKISAAMFAGDIGQEQDKVD